MNIIEAAKALDQGNDVRDPMGFRFRDVNGIVCHVDSITGHTNNEATMYVDDLLSDEWEVVYE